MIVGRHQTLGEMQGIESPLRVLQKQPTLPTPHLHCFSLEPWKNKFLLFEAKLVHEDLSWP